MAGNVCRFTSCSRAKKMGIVMLGNRTVLLGAVAALALCSVSSGWAAGAPSENPFDAPSTLPFQAPPFDRIKDSDFEPAFQKGMAQQIAEMDKIANNPAPATFDNTIVEMEKSGRMLDRVQLRPFLT
jgi:peptidyl-dipeptidase Dcp